MINLIELSELLDILINVRNSEYAADQMMTEEIDRMIEVVKDEIKVVNNEKIRNKNSS
jgi:hypothetical protein